MDGAMCLRNLVNRWAWPSAPQRAVVHREVVHTTQGTADDDRVACTCGVSGANGITVIHIGRLYQSTKRGISYFGTVTPGDFTGGFTNFFFLYDLGVP